MLSEKSISSNCKIPVFKIECLFFLSHCNSLFTCLLYNANISNNDEG